MSKEGFIIKSDDGREYPIPDINIFFKHLTDFHTVNGNCNNSLHEENGFYFTVTHEFYLSVKKMLNSKK
ncbi:hypothetical protein OBA41_04025 [Pelagibacteraceae bacterium]|nr:hypothetical protein [Pelagibacteraceae bacterium]